MITIAQMKAALDRNNANIQSIGAQEAPDMRPKAYISPVKGQGAMLPPGGVATPSGLPIGGVDMSRQQPGQQMMPQQLGMPQGMGPGMQPPQGGPPPEAPDQGNQINPQQGSNILQMTPQGQALNAMKGPPGPKGPQEPQGLAGGGQPESEEDPVADMLAKMLMSKYQPKSKKASEVFGQHEGKTLNVTQSDRTKVGEGFLGGPGFSSLQHIKPEYAGAAWGVNHPAVASSIINANARTPEGSAIWSTMIGSPSQHTSNKMVFDLMKQKFKAGIKSGKLSPELRNAINAQLSMAVTKDGEPIFEGGADIASKNFFDNLDTFEKRRVMADLFGGIKVGGKKGQIFDYGKILEDTTEPELRGAPTFAIGPRLFTVNGERSKRPDLHPAFPHIVHGEDLGVMYHPVPKEIMLPDFHERIAKEKKRKVGYMDLVRNTPSQFLSEEFLTKLQKKGYKKGGAAKNMDTMRLELTKRGKGK